MRKLLATAALLVLTACNGLSHDRLDALERDLNSIEIAKRQEAARGLAESGDPVALKPLLERLRTEGEFDVRLDLVRAVGNLYRGRDEVRALGTKEATELILPYVADTDDRLRAAAVAALGAVGDPAAFDPLFRSTNDEKDLVRAAALAGLGDLGDERGLARLHVCARDTQPVVRAAAIAAMAGFATGAQAPVLLPALEDPHPSVRRAAAIAVKDLPDPRVEAALTARLQDPDPGVREAVAQTLAARAGTAPKP